MQDSHQAIEHFAAELLVDVSILLVVHSIRSGADASRAEDFLYELLNLLLVVHPIPVVDVATLALLVQAFPLLGPLLQPTDRVARRGAEPGVR